MDIDTVMELAKARKSVRVFKKDPVPEDMLQKIAAAASLAPTGNNTQPMEIVVVRHKALIHEIETIIGESFLPPMTQRFDAPAMFVILGDPRFCAGYPEGFVREGILHSSLCLAIENMFLAMAALGLGSVWKEVPPSAAVRIKALLKIPQVFVLKTILPVGFPGKGYREKRPKRTIPLHLDHYHTGKFKSTEEIEALMKKYCRVKELGKVRAL
ncbi:MAG TPA: nitroreductase family protein [Syntrophales bacterium]|nr:nitroreductase family protein [Syntrophales bacterium]